MFAGSQSGQKLDDSVTGYLGKHMAMVLDGAKKKNMHHQHQDSEKNTYINLSSPSS